MIIERRGTVSVDPKSANVKSKASNADVIRAMESALAMLTNEQEDETEENVTCDSNTLSQFLRGLPYGADTAFGYTTLIDPRFVFACMYYIASPCKISS